MSTSSGATKSGEESARLAAVVVYLSGAQRGRSVRIEDATLYLAREDGRPLTPEEACESPEMATVRRTAAGYELVAPRRQVVWVNGEPADVRILESGDLIEFDNGPVLRFQLTTSEERSHRHLMKSLGVRAEAARPSPQFPLGRARPGTTLRELATRTWRRSRARVLLVLAILIGAIAYQSLQTQDLERQLVREQKRVSGLAELLRKLEGQTLTRAELDALRDELSKGLIDTGERVRALEASSAAVSQIIARSSASVAFVQGSFGFEDPATKRPLRFAVTKNGSPIRAPDGRPVLTVEGSGPLVKVRFTGTAFVVNRDGVLLTNRHVAMPWEDEPLLPAIRELGLEPVMQRMQGYLSGASAPFDVTFLGASDTHDVAVVQGDGGARATAPLLLSGDPLTPGDTAILLGFPAGIRALLARTGDAFVQELSHRPNVDDEASSLLRE